MQYYFGMTMLNVKHREMEHG